MNRALFRFSVLLLVVSVVPAAGASFSFTVPEHSETRIRLQGMLTGPLSTITASMPTDYRQNTTIHRVRFRYEETRTHLYLLFLNESRGEFPLVGRGAWIIRRNAASGEFEQIKVFLADDPDFFVRLAPRGTRTEMEVVMAGDTVFRDVMVPMPFERVLVAPFADIQRATAGVVDWNLFSTPDARSEYAVVERMVGRLRAALPTLPDAEDGAMDRHGNLVCIESLVLQDQEPGFNCSGFAKWVVDGLYRARTGEFLDIEAMRERHIGLRGHRWSDRHEYERDPYFGLDWTRNLATAMIGLDNPAGTIAPTAADVGAVRFSNSIPNVGFEIKSLARTLYLLARRHPGDFYLGSVNQDFGTAPVLRQHVHIVVIFPYFDAAGRFRVVVMERNVESSVGSLVRRYESDSVHLVRVRASDEFQIPIFRSDTFVE